MDIQVECFEHTPILRVLESVGTYEITAIFCKECNEQLSETKTEC